MESGGISSQFSPIGISTNSLLFCWKSRRIIFYNAYGKYIFTAGNKHTGNIEFATDESAADTSEIMTIQVNLRFPVDAIKIEVHLFTFVRSRRCEYITIPKVRIEIGIRNKELVIAVIRIGQCAIIQITH